MEQMWTRHDDTQQKADVAAGGILTFSNELAVGGQSSSRNFNPSVLSTPHTCRHSHPPGHQAHCFFPSELKSHDGDRDDHGLSLEKRDDVEEAVPLPWGLEVTAQPGARGSGFWCQISPRPGTELSTGFCWAVPKNDSLRLQSAQAQLATEPAAKWSFAPPRTKETCVRSTWLNRPVLRPTSLDCEVHGGHREM
ncbi:dnaJ homolog subfamily C member 5G isoform X2 [Peromyscus leucopus]|uniref:dnaJ homolog subfamily C member 5G isoform X2 n=1 Tax=Peromyscus leucopus TaxID=10041 RepID=UPI0018857AEA|nr:dnaJ homolog subfamily C member 5G isoform X2 [Peromyscus leucopus]